MRYFPIQIDTKNKKLLVIGGGKIAERKLKSFLGSEVDITVMSEGLTLGIIELEKEGRIKIIREKAQETLQLDDVDFLIIATDDKDLNTKLCTKAKSANILVLDASHGDDSSFHMSRIIHKNKAVVTIATEGDVPALSEILAENIASVVEQMDAEKIELISKIRKKLVLQENKNIKEITKSLYFKPVNEIEYFLNSLE